MLLVGKTHWINTVQFYWAKNNHHKRKASSWPRTAAKKNKSAITIFTKGEEIFMSECYGSTIINAVKVVKWFHHRATSKSIMWPENTWFQISPHGHRTGKICCYRSSVCLRKASMKISGIVGTTFIVSWCARSPLTYRSATIHFNDNSIHIIIYR